MDTQKRDRHCQLANSFVLDEVDALLKLHSALLRGGSEARSIACSPAMLNVVRKFLAMRAKRSAYDGALRLAGAPVGRSS